MDSLFLNEYSQLKKWLKFKKKCGDLVKWPLCLILFLNDHAYLKKWFKLKKTSVKTLLNHLSGYLIFKCAFKALKLAKIKND